MSFSPVEASKNIVKKYNRYLHTIFSIDNEEYNNQLKNQLISMQTLATGPYLDVSDSFEKGLSIEQLIDKDMLAKGFNKIRMPIKRPLYKHQQIAIEKTIKGENLIVSTGTGSGKTESFLIPVLNHIIREHEAGKLDKGVRALIIYPMNALANDQVERLRDLLADYQEITYGSYTGQTKNKYNEALAEYKQLNDNQEPQKNELISREQIKENPPHILITNYAMLEYLMVRPGDSIFFNEENAKKWRYIVLDEAHVYNGSSGIEVSMLLRRLKAKLQNDEINYILTSATLGDETSNAEVAEFGENLCNSNFDITNIVRAYRITPCIEHDRERLDIELYKCLAEKIDNGYSDKEVSAYISKCNDYDESLSLEENLYNIILHDENYSEIKKYSAETETINMLAQKMGWTEDELVNFVTIASKAEKNGERLFDARYHMFLRATESVFITLNPSNKLFLTRKKRHIDYDGKDYAVFEIATCSVCHAVYLIGTIKENTFVQSSFQNEDELKSVFLLKNEISDTDDDHSMEDENLEAEEYEICPRCGFIRRAGLLKESCCEHGSAGLIKVFKVYSKNEKGIITKCPACENTNTSGILRMFFTGQEAVTSVIGTALFESLPSYKLVHERIEQEDDLGFGVNEDFVTRTVSEAKQFIAFSDSRQAAAFYASYLDQTYHRILYKRLIVETINSFKNTWKGEMITDFVNDLAAKFEEKGVIKLGTNLSLKEAWKAVLQEMADNNGVTSLYNMGLIGFSLDAKFFRENKKLGMSAEDVCTLCNVLILGMMADTAIDYEFSMNKADKEFFTHNGVEFEYTLSEPDVKRYRRSFIPRYVGKSNKRCDYFKRVLEKMGVRLEEEKVNKYLEAIWNNILVKEELLKPRNGAYKVNCNRMMIMKPTKWYICPKCRRITPYNLHNVCTSYKCTGELIDIDLSKEYKDNHYYRLYQELDIRDLRVVEHTAQLGKETAYEYQKKFKKKEIDVLSCSTTFEMGVDVGSLETVFMRNMPPSPSNYAQRAGRAGRSRNAAAFALTFCNKSNHDFAFFSNPVDMIKGRIDPPKFIVENEKIAIRHIYASALAFFWSRYPDYFSTASIMTEESDEGESGVKKFTEYLNSKPEDLKQYLKKFLPKMLLNRIDIEDYGWIDYLIGEELNNPGVLSKAVAEYDYEVGILKEAKEEALKRGTNVDPITQRIKVYQKEDILAFLSRKNVMPKYGFPVDTVEMSVNGRGDKAKLGLQLSRDLALAISEYSPGSQIVANGNLITSRYIRKVPRMSWKMYDYINCDCRTMNIEPHVEGRDSTQLCKCHQCGSTLDQKKRKVFLVPEFGFEADGEKIEKPGLKKPERTYRGEVSYVGYRANVDVNRFNIGNALFEIAVSKNDEMAVTNNSNFYVCETCGYTDLDDKSFDKYKQIKHKSNIGYSCRNKLLKRFSLGYRFETDVLQLRFIYPDLLDFDESISILYGLIRGICVELHIEQNEIAGCVQYYYNELTSRENFSMVFYDKTPGGAGHVRRLADPKVMEKVLRSTLQIMEGCNCGGTDMDSSCYQCLRSYYNQKFHDKLSRGKVIDFIKSLLTENLKPIDIKEDNDRKQVGKLKINPKSSHESFVKDVCTIIFSEVGANQSNYTSDEIWDNILEDCDTEGEKEVINEIKKMCENNIAKPIYGEKARLSDMDKEFDIDLVWKDRGIMLFLDANYDSYEIAKQTGWNCYCTGVGFDIAEFIKYIEE